jgi:hypothetical protein
VTDKPLSAAQARALTSGRKPVSTRDPPNKYTLTDNGVTVLRDAVLKEIKAFLPNTAEHLLVKRLGSGERDVKRLTRKPDGKGPRRPVNSNYTKK